jgi:hypothetical protein
LLRAVSDEGDSFAIRHFGRVIAFLVPVAGREPRSEGGRIVYAVTPKRPLTQLNASQTHVLRALASKGPLVDPTVGLGLTAGETMRLLATMTYGDGLLRQAGGCWELTPYGATHVDGL